MILTKGKKIFISNHYMCKGILIKIIHMILQEIYLLKGNFNFGDAE